MLQRYPTERAATVLLGHLARGAERIGTEWISGSTGSRLLTAAVGPALVAPLVVLVFVADTITPWQVAVGALYAIAVLTAVFFYERRGVLLVSAICVALGLISFAITRESFSAVLTEILAVVATTYLALKIKSAESEVREARIQLAHFGRLAVLGEMASSIAHDVNQPLAAIVANSSASLLWLDRPTPDLAEARRALTRTVRDANRASEVVARIRRLASKGTQHVERLGLNPLIIDVLALLRHQIAAAGVRVQTDLADRLPAVVADRSQVQQVILNLVLNAIEAVAVKVGGARHVVVSSFEETSGHVCLTVSDTGEGFDPSIADRMFDAFFTTKAHAMGMGLAISRSIIEAYNGRIWATAGNDGGTVLHVRLPCARRTGSESTTKR